MLEDVHQRDEVKEIFITLEITKLRNIVLCLSWRIIGYIIKKNLQI